MITLSWNFDKPYYSPGDKARIDLWVENRGLNYISISEVAVEFEFGIYELPAKICGIVPPPYSGLPNVGYLGFANLTLPPYHVGVQKFNLRYRIHELINQKWLSGAIHKTSKFIINIYSKPVYNIFLSRGIHLEDRLAGDPIAQMILEWGCNPITVGINISVPEDQVPSEIEKQIQGSAGLVVIATPRILDYSTYTWRTLEWANSEAGMAYANRKPILILRDKNVSLGGLLAYSQRQIEFDPQNLPDVKAKLAIIMPAFRKAIEQHNTNEFNRDLKDLAIKGLAAFGGLVLLSGIIGSIMDEK